MPGDGGGDVSHGGFEIKARLNFKIKLLLLLACSINANKSCCLCNEMKIFTNSLEKIHSLRKIRNFILFQNYKRITLCNIRELMFKLEERRKQ